MKKYAARYLSKKEKERAVRRIRKGEKASSVSKEIKVSRPTLYKWLKIDSLGKRDLSRKRREGKISEAQRRKVIKLALKYPDYPIRKVGSLSGLSTGLIWAILKKRSLSTKEQRKAHFLTKGTSLYKRVGDIDRGIMIGRYRAGEPVTRICSDYGVSRTIFYKWINKHDVSKKGRPKGVFHWRFIAGMDGIVRDLVARNPELSLSELHNRIKLKHMALISRSGLYYVCKRLELTTYEKRLTYAQYGEVMVASQRDDVSLFLQLAFLSISSLVLSFWVMVFGHRIMEYVPTQTVEVNVTEQGKQVYEEKLRSEEIVYTVKAGDNLWHISEEIYESGYNWVDIANANRLPDPDFIDIGQKLVIPTVRARVVTLVVRD